MSKLKNWLLANNFKLNSHVEGLYTIELNKYKEKYDEEVTVFLDVYFENNIIEIYVYSECYSEYFNNKITLFKTDKEDDVDRYWILDTIKFLKKW